MMVDSIVRRMRGLCCPCCCIETLEQDSDKSDKSTDLEEEPCDLYNGACMDYFECLNGVFSRIHVIPEFQTPEEQEVFARTKTPDEYISTDSYIDDQIIAKFTVLQACHVLGKLLLTNQIRGNRMEWRTYTTSRVLYRELTRGQDTQEPLEVHEDMEISGS